MGSRAWLLAALPCLLLDGCSGQQPPTGKGLVAEPPLATCENESDSVYRDECYKKHSREPGKRGYCLLMKEASARALCILSAAGREVSVDDCAQAAEIWPNTSCFTDLARRKVDVGICDQLRGLVARDACIKDTAHRAGKIELCSGMKQPAARDDCVRSLATVHHQVAECAPIVNPFRRDECRMSFASASAAGAAACATIENQRRRDDCYIRQVSRPEQSPQLCEQVILRKDFCWRKAAIATDPALCEHVGADASSFARAACYDAVAAYASPRGADFCSTIPQQMQKEKCWSRLAKRARDPSRCRAITNRELADDCWADIGFDNVDHCVNIKRPEQSRSCIRENWFKATDPRVCALLAPRELQEACRGEVARRKR